MLAGQNLVGNQAVTLGADLPDRAVAADQA
jgi:hypothetical protein